MGTCRLCPPGDDRVADEDLLEHLRVTHPTRYGDGPERWPDGEPVVTDETLEPGDFR